MIKEEGKTYNVDKEVTDQKTLEVSKETPDNAKVEDKKSFEDFKTVYEGQITEKCLADYGTTEDKKLWEDTAKELYLQSQEYIPDEEDKPKESLDDKLEESKEIKAESVSEEHITDIHQRIEAAEDKAEIKAIINDIEDTYLGKEVRLAFDQCEEDNDDLEVTKDFVITTLEDNAVYEESKKVEETRTNRTLHKGDRFVNPNGAEIKIIDVDNEHLLDGEPQVTYQIGKEHKCYKQSSVNATIDQNRYELQESEKVEEVVDKTNTPEYDNFQMDMEVIEKGLDRKSLTSPEALEIVDELNDIMNQRWASVEQNKFGIKYESKETEEE